MAKPENKLVGKTGPDTYTKAGKDDVGVGELVTSSSGIKPQQRKLHDPAVTFEEYLHYAQHTRIEESEHPPVGREKSFWSLIFPSKSDAGVTQKEIGIEKANLSGPGATSGVVSDEEWTNASRALRTATRGVMLLSHHHGHPWTVRSSLCFCYYGLGPRYHPIHHLRRPSWLLGLPALPKCSSPSTHMSIPVRSFGDLGYRLYGPWMRYMFNFLQGIQLLLLVGLNIIMSGESLSQVSKFQLCFAVCCLVCTLVGMVAGQVRTLQKLGWLSNAAVWINLLCVFVTMGAVANYPRTTSCAGAVIDGGKQIEPDANGNYPPMRTSGGLPHSDSFAGSVSGAMQAVYAYGGSMLFPEFMAEMKRPKDFLGAMVRLPRSVEKKAPSDKR
ncbi:hypothetical protein PG994_013734 [Apiospora phragmitis]|uniref:Amino acid transporter transmembrane domain-containing protein n=1 Tax=Apiospora phragmitis TaxID=2905665 RepID=A0ABR1TB92_9PEZI